MIKGFHCPETSRDLTFDECLECAASHENPCQFDYPILATMRANIRRQRGITVSSVLGCLRKVALEMRTDLYLDPRQLYYAFRGQLFHTVIAQAQSERAVCEKRFARTVAGIVLSGQPDVIYPQHRKLVDYKSTRRIPREDRSYDQHSLQVNLYRYLILPRYPIDQLQIVYFDMSEVKRCPVEVMPEPQLVEWLTPRLTELKEALDGGKLPHQTGPDGFWQCAGYCSFTAFCWPEGVPKTTRSTGRASARPRGRAAKRNQG